MAPEFVIVGAVKVLPLKLMVPEFVKLYPPAGVQVPEPIVKVAPSLFVNDMVDRVNPLPLCVMVPLFVKLPPPYKPPTLLIAQVPESMVTVPLFKKKPRP